MAPESYAPDQRLLRKVLRRPVVPQSLQILDSVSERLYERLALIKKVPSSVLDLGTGNARHLAQLAKNFPRASVFGADLSLSRLHSAGSKRKFWQKRQMLVCADANGVLPFNDASFDLLVSNMLLPWVFDAAHLMAEINRMLTVDGAFFISTAGPDTLIELRNAWSQIDDCLHINAFMDMHDLGDLLLAAGVADPVLDTERITVTYSSLDALLTDLVGLGFINVLQGRRRGLMSPSVKKRLAENYPINDDGGINATLELVVGHGWAGQLSDRQGTGGEFYYPIERLRKGS